ncbi:MAG: hypothetical protein DF168_00997 [Candidatus Moanabacter tarae]|uniref:Uncharacterized protein n=1 Tax=Candidatus Moanibacter tarae TaxID=2200854 RepID=A0A2Z4APU2_9BACT|nr:MAG: hypothetical protein DF168_00997 [Candidatus Moanabacter tarae]
MRKIVEHQIIVSISKFISFKAKQELQVMPYQHEIKAAIIRQISTAS